MSTETTTTTKPSFREAIDNCYALYASREQSQAVCRETIKALDTLPKTPTGKDTKAVKEAKAAIAAKQAAESADFYTAQQKFLDHVAEHAFTYNAGVTALHAIELTLEPTGFHYAPDATEKCRAATANAKKDNGSTKVGFNPRYVHERNDFVFVKVAHDTVLGYAIIRRDDEGVHVRYITDKAPVDGTPYGTLFREDDNALSSFHGIGKYDINLSAVGTEEFDTCLRRLALITQAIQIQKTLTARHKTYCGFMKDYFTAAHLSLVEFLAGNPDAKFGFRVNEKGVVEPCGFIASDESIVYGSVIN